VQNVVKGNEKLQNYGGNMNFISGRGDGSLAKISETDAEYDETQRHTTMKSDFGKVGIQE